MTTKLFIPNVFLLRRDCSVLKHVDKIIICCKRSVVRKLVYEKRIKKNDIIKQQSALLHGTKLYLFVDKFVNSGSIEHYFGAVNNAFNMTNVKCSIKGTNNNFRKDTLRRLLLRHVRAYVDSETSSTDSRSS